MIQNKWRILLLFLFLEDFLFTDQSHAEKALNASRQFDREKLNVNVKNMEALNNFLEDVLTAKDELKWIDQMIYPQARRHKSYETRRRLLSARRGVASKKKKHTSPSNNTIKRAKSNLHNHNNNDNDNNNNHDNDKKNKNAVKKSTKKSIHKKITKKSIINPKRHYFTPNAQGFGVLEYYDYDVNDNKRKPIRSKSVKLVSRTTRNNKATKNSSKKKLKKKKSRDKNREYKVLQELVVSNQGNLHSAKSKHAREASEHKRMREDNDNAKEIEMEDGLENTLSDAAKVNGREARCHRDEDDGNADDYNDKTQQNSKDYRKYKRMKDGNYQFSDDLYDDEFNPFFPEIGNSSSPGSDYQALKATDDMFKGGMEQGNTNDDKDTPSSEDCSQKKIFNQWKTDRKADRLKKKLIITLNKSTPSDDDEVMSNLLDSSSSVNEVNDHKKLKEKRSKIMLGPIPQHESVVEPLNWPWEYYDDKDESKIRFGRGLMQVLPEDYDDKDSPLFNKESNKSQYRVKRDVFNHTEDDDISLNITVNGLLANEIVNKIYEQVEASDTLNSVLRPGLSRKTKVEDHAPPKCTPDEHIQEVNRTATILRQVGKLLNHLVAQKMQKKLCLKLSPHQRDFLIWITESDPYKFSHKEPQHDMLFKHYEKPAGNLEKAVNEVKSRYLFGHYQKPANSKKMNDGHESSFESPIDDDDIHSKILLLKRLIRQYESLGESEQIQAEAIHRHLKKQLNFLTHYEDGKNKFKKSPNVYVSSKHNQSAKKYQNSSYHFSVNKEYKSVASSSSLNNRKYGKRNPKGVSGKIENKIDMSKNIKNLVSINDGVEDDGKSLNLFYSSSTLMSLSSIRSSSSTIDSNQNKELKHFSSSTCNPRTKYDRWTTGVFENITTNNFLSPSNQSSVKSIEFFSTISSTSLPLAAFSHNSASDENGTFVIENHTYGSDVIVDPPTLISLNINKYSEINENNNHHPRNYLGQSTDNKDDLVLQLKHAKDLESLYDVDNRSHFN